MSIALLASTATAQQRARRPSTPGGFAEGRLMKKNATEIGLSEETIAKIDAAMEVGTAAEEEIREENKAAIKKLNEVLAKNMPSEKELLSAADKLGEISSKSRTRKMKSVIEIRSFLTKEELEKFMEIRQKAASRR